MQGLYGGRSVLLMQGLLKFGLREQGLVESQNFIKKIGLEAWVNLQEPYLIFL